MFKMGNKFRHIKQKLTHSCPKLGKKYTKTAQNLHNLYKFITLGCPDPSPSVYVVNMEPFVYTPMDIRVGQEKDLEFEVFGQYFFNLPPDPKNTAKITGL